MLFQTTDRGLHWKIISPDLTRNVKEHQAPSGGPITHDVSGAEESDTILDIEGSKLHQGEIWVGTDDGLIQLTLDDGKHWRNVTPPNAPEYGRFASISPSPLRDGTAYAINDGHYTGDSKPYVFVTHDFGKTWSSITSGLPQAEWARSIGADIRNPNLVYLGTEEGFWISYDGGATWKAFKNNLPTVSVHDIRMQQQFDDLVIATHGRSIYIMDDMTPIQQLQTATAAGTYMFPISVSYQYNTREDDEGTYTNYAAPNPPAGAIIDYYLDAEQKTPPTLKIIDQTGAVVRTYQGTHEVEKKQVPYVPNKVGLNRFVWDWAIDGPVKWTGAAKKAYQGPEDGPLVPPGRYIAQLTLGNKTFTHSFIVKPDPRTLYTQAQIVESYRFARAGEAMFSQVDTMLNNLDTVKKSIDDGIAAAKKAADSATQTKLESIEAARTTVFDQLTANYQNDEDSIQMPGKVREDVQTIMFFGGAVITPSMRDYAHRVEGDLKNATANYNAFVATQLPALNQALTTLKLKAVTIP